MAANGRKQTGATLSGSFHAGKVLREVRAQLRKITFTGNHALRLDSGSRLRSHQQHWSATLCTPVLFEGLFCIPVINVHLRLSEPLSVPARVTIRGEADNGMIFSREFSFPAGNAHHDVSGLEADRPVGGIFDLVTRTTWHLESADVRVFLDGPREFRHSLYFVPRWEASKAPLESVVHVTCVALKGLGPGHPSALERIWDAIEPLDVPAADGESRLVCRGPVKRRETAKDLLRTRSGGREAWLDFFRRCMELAYSRPEGEASGDSSQWPWTVDSVSLKERLLEAKCQHVLRGAS